MILEQQREGGTLVLTLNRPEAANSLNPALLDALGAALADAADDDGVRCLVLAAAGDRIFCAGMDLTALADAAARDGAADPRAAAAREQLFAGGFPKPIVAAVNGTAAGGGFELVLACDLVVAAEHARFGLPEVRRGLFPAGAGTLLGTRIPLAVALEIGLTGELIPAARALELGLLNRVVPAGQALPAALGLAGRIAANGPLAVRRTKRLMRAAVDRDPAAGRATPDDLAAIFTSADAREGAAAFLEKREPRFTGT